MMHEKKELANCVSQISYQDSVLDEGVSNINSTSCDLMSQHVCKMCIPNCAFPTEKALNSHARSKHDVVSLIPKYIDGSGLCPACKSVFCSRIRVIAHLSDTRRPRCRDRVLAGEFPAIADDVFVQLQSSDRETRKSALHEGHTHPIAVGSAQRADGNKVGRLSR